MLGLLFTLLSLCISFDFLARVITLLLCFGSTVLEASIVVANIFVNGYYATNKNNSVLVFNDEFIHNDEAIRSGDFLSLLVGHLFHPSIS